MYVGVAGVDRLIVVMSVGMLLAVHLTAKRNSATDKPKKAKSPTVWPKTVVGIVKTSPFQKRWMMLLQGPLLIGLWWHCVRKIWWVFALILKAAVIFVVEWV